MKRIYLDYASTTPVDPQVIKAMEPYFFERFGNAASSHSFGQEALKAIEDSRETIARSLGVQEKEIYFTSGATESNNHILFGSAKTFNSKGNHIIISSIEHHSVLEPAQYLANNGFDVTFLKMDAQGIVDLEDLKRSISNKTILIGVMFANNEIGTIQPLAEISKMAKAKNIPFFVDAVQAVGHLPFKMSDIGADFLTLTGHKFYGPKGVGAMYIRKGINIQPLLLGGSQERSVRASTQNVVGAVGIAKALELCISSARDEAKHHQEWRDYLFREVPQRISGVKINGHLTNRLAHNLHFSFEGISGEELLVSLDQKGIAASMGSTCSAGSMEPSHVLKAIGLSDELAKGSLRVTLGRWTTKDDIEYFLGTLTETIKQLRR